MSEKAMRFCPSCRQNKLNKGFTAVRRKDGRITHYRCPDCKKGLPGRSPYFAKTAQPEMARDKKHYRNKHTLEHFQKEINDRE